jgi:hypothetical protein
MVTYLIKVEQLIPEGFVKHAPAVLGRDDNSSKFARPRQPEVNCNSLILWRLF